LRACFANTLKYVFTTTSANFGNMFSMAGASIFLPFLPLLAKQILLNGILLFVIRASPEQFRTGWFVESVMTELVIALVVRTRRLFYRSKPGRWLWVSTLLVAVITIVIPYLPFSELLGFTPLPFPVMLGLLLITALYVLAAELAKKFFYFAGTMRTWGDPSSS
jgi:Mg2+-importing ATPase